MCVRMRVFKSTTNNVPHNGHWMPILAPSMLLLSLPLLSAFPLLTMATMGLQWILLQRRIRHGPPANPTSDCLLLLLLWLSDAEALGASSLCKRQIPPTAQRKTYPNFPYLRLFLLSVYPKISHALYVQTTNKHTYMLTFEHDHVSDLRRNNGNYTVIIVRAWS